ncbi:MAG: hypothetical protein ACP5NV_03135 [Candidatus Woesearchaeota archaeon]
MLCYEFLLNDGGRNMKTIKKRSIIAWLNKEKLSKYEMDELFM